MRTVILRNIRHELLTAFKPTVLWPDDQPPDIVQWGGKAVRFLDDVRLRDHVRRSRFVLVDRRLDGSNTFTGRPRAHLAGRAAASGGRVSLPKDVLRAMRKHLADDNRKYSDEFVAFPKEFWPREGPHNSSPGATRIQVWRNRHFLVQVFEEGNFTRLSVNRTRIKSDGHFEENISWQDLQDIKNAIGFDDSLAIELYPPAKHVVNVSNIRHLWIVNEKAYPFMWRKKENETDQANR